MHVGIVNNETWRFLNELHDDLQMNHQIEVFNKRVYNLPVFNTRINRYIFSQDLDHFIKRNNVVFFEWASEILAEASHNTKKYAGIVTRLHRYEMYQWIDKINWNFVDRIIFVSEAKRSEFIKSYPNQAKKSTVIPVGINIDRYSPISKKFSGDIGILGDLTPRKRVYDLILVFAELIKRQKNLHLHVGGGAHPSHGDYFHAIETMIERLNLEDKVTLYGNVTNTQEWFRKIDIFISNSYSEGLQVAPMEAMASGCYCLSHHWTGADELLPEENLYLTNDDLQLKVQQYTNLSDPQKQRSKEFMRTIICDKFDSRLIIPQIRQVIESAANAV